MKRPVRTKLATFENIEYRRLLGIIRRVRARWRLKVLLQGLALLLGTGLVTLGLAAWGADLFRARPWVTVILSVATYGSLAFYLWRFVVRPLLRRPSDREVALYIEKRSPELRAALVSAVEFGDPASRQDMSAISPRFVEKVVEQALDKGPTIDFGRSVERDNLKRVSGYLGAASMAALAVLLIDPAFLGRGLPLLFGPWGIGGGATPYSVSVDPGNAEVARGGDQLVTARLAGFDSDRVEISFKSGDGEWERLPMSAGERGHEFLLTRLGEPVEYWVEASGVRSEIYRLEVVDVPWVHRIRMELIYPEYAGLEPELIEEGGDIAALPGTRARLFVEPTVNVPGGRLRLEIPGDPEPSVEHLPLAPGATGLEGEIVVTEPGYYRVELESFDGDYVEGSSEYVIDVLSDVAPLLTLDAPGRDIQVTAVEEVFTEVSAEDDYGLASVELVYTLNGGQEQTLPLLGGRSESPTEMTSAHTFYLEEWELQPGDFIAYWARAVDERGDAEGAVTETDIYFIEVRPFSRELTQAPQGGGGGGGGGGGPQGFDLARRQRDLVAATFKLQRDAGSLPGPQLAEDLELLADIQDQVREGTLNAAQQASQLRASGDMTAGLRALQQGAEEMEAAAERLRAGDAEGALPPEGRALMHLQRFMALITEMQLAMGGGGGGGGGEGMEGLEEMFDIDPGELRNQYEAVQRGRQEQADNQVDEALQRLNELARRQQQEIERQRAQARSPSQAGGGGGGSQREIAEQAEELARRLERLSRQNTDSQLQEAANRLRQAVDSMRRSAASGTEESMAESQRALNELQNARRLLDEQRGDRLARDLRDAQQRIDRLRGAQEAMEDQVASLGEAGGRTPERMESILDGKDGLDEEIRDLERQLDDMARASRGDQLRTSRGLQEAAEFIRDSKLADKVRYSKGVVQERDPRYAAGFEEDISRDLQQLDEMIDAAAGSVERSESERLAEALEDTRDLVRRLESFEERAQQGESGEEGDGEAQGQSAGGRPGDRQGPGQGDNERPGGVLGGGGDGAPDGRQLQREFRQRIDDAERLREALGAEGVQTTDLDGVIAAMRDFDEGFDGTTRGLDELRGDVIDGLKLFEFWLRRVTDATSGQRPQLSSSDAVPEGYRALVEEYFRALAREEGER